MLRDPLQKSNSEVGLGKAQISGDLIFSSPAKTAVFWDSGRDSNRLPLADFLVMFPVIQASLQ